MSTEKLALEGRVAIVTGANTGIGKVTAKTLAEQGAQVFMACRSESKARAAIEELSEGRNLKIEFLALDLGDLSSVRRAAEEFLARDLPLHILVNNAGLAGSRGLTKDGFELTFGVNHIGHFLFTQLLLDVLKTSAPARIVNVSSKSHYQAKTIHFERQRVRTKSFTGLKEYETSKLANVLFTAELARRLEGSGVSSYAVHPGVVASDIWHRVPRPFRNIAKRFMISVEEGAQTSLHCALSPEAAEQSGLYYDRSKPRSPNPVAKDREMAAELWERSLTWTGLPPQASA
jgi:NAD(P)-dependent dehydrogenase (short-subunit alcohol dehydrogenase family)